MALVPWVSTLVFSDVELHRRVDAVGGDLDRFHLTDADTRDPDLLAGRHAGDVLEDGLVGRLVAELGVGDGRRERPGGEQGGQHEEDELDQAGSGLHRWLTTAPRSIGPASRVVMADGSPPSATAARDHDFCSSSVPARPESASAMPAPERPRNIDGRALPGAVAAALGAVVEGIARPRGAPGSRTLPGRP